MFPEGTRAPRGGQGKYKNGGTRLAGRTGRPVLPVAVTSARCWPRKSFVLRPGVIDVSIGKPIPRPAATRLADARGRDLDEGEMRRLDPRPIDEPAGPPKGEYRSAQHEGTPVTSRLARGLRRIADVLQRGLFDVDEERVPEIEVPAAADPARHPRANREFVLDGRRIGFLLKRSRRRSIGFVVGAEGLAVSAPKWVTLRDVDAAVREKGVWILAKLDEQRQRAQQSAAGRIVWGDGAVLQYLGAPVRVTLDARPGSPPARCCSTMHRRRPRPARRRRAAARRPGAWRVARAAARPGAELAAARGAGPVEARCRHYAERLGVRVTRLSLPRRRRAGAAPTPAARSGCTGGWSSIRSPPSTTSSPTSWRTCAR